MAASPIDSEKQHKLAQKTLEKAEKSMGTEKWDNAQGFLLEAIDLFLSIRAAPEEAQCYFLLGVSYENEKKLEEALKAYKTAATLREDLHIPVELANTHKRIAKVYLFLNNLEEAKNSCQKAIDLLEDQNQPLNLVDALYLQGLLYLREDNPQSAQFYLNMAIERVPNLHQIYLAADIFERLGIAEQHLAQFNNSNNHLMQSLRIQQDRKNLFSIITILTNLSENWKHLNDKIRSTAFIEDAIKLSIQNSNQVPADLRFDLHEKYIETLFLFSELKKAEEKCEEMITQAETANNQYWLMRFLLKMATLITARAHADAQALILASNYQTEALEIAQKTKDNDQIALCILQNARILFQQNKLNESLQLISQANDYAEKNKTPIILGEVYDQYAIFFHGQGNYEKALQYFEKSTAEYDKTYSFSDIAEAHYNIACISAILHLPEQTITHLKKAVTLNVKFKEIAQKDDDFKSIQNDPPFHDLVK